MEVKIKGMKELFKVLDGLPSKLKKRVMKKSLRAGAMEVKKGIRREARMLRGKGVKAGTTKRGKQRYKHTLETAMGIVEVYSAMGIRYFVHHFARTAHLVEFGTRAHTIVPWRRRKRSRTRRTMKKAMLLPNGKFIARARHPGARKNPFFSRGFSKSAMASINRIALQAEREIRRLRLKNVG